jgi:hypothetical protein
MMKRVVLAIGIVGLMLACSTVQALPINQSITAVADRLVATQAVDGSWAGEELFTGSIVAGLVHAYELTGNPVYMASAEAGGAYIMTTNGTNPYGDEAYALARLTEITGNMVYSDTAKSFYNSIDTYGYIRGFIATDASNAVFYVANNAVAANKVGADDAAVWRDALVQYLAQIDDDAAQYPVMSVGVATWALNQIGPMDGTRVDPFGLIGQDIWEDVLLSDLVTMVADQIDPSNDTFYHRLDHTAAGPGFETSGYLEDTVFGLLGLISANDPSLDAEILAGRIAMANGIAPDGIAYEHMINGGANFATFAGEFLQAIPEPATMILLGIGGLLAARKRR